MASTPLEERYIHVQHVFPSSWAVTEAMANIGRTMFETDRIPAEWVAPCNAMDEIWVPSRFHLETFARAGVDPSKLAVIPGAVDVERFGAHVEPFPLPHRAGFNFLSVFDMTMRKGWDILLAAYVLEFTAEEDVPLHLKIDSSLGRTPEMMAQMIDVFLREGMHVDPERIPDVSLITDPFTQDEMASLYRAADAFVLPTRGEGWGRPCTEAMATGVPVIATGWSGVTEYLSPETGYPIDFQMTDVQEMAVDEAPWFGGHQWAEPSIEHLRRLLRHVYQNREEARRIGEAGRAAIHQNFTPDRVAARIVERLKSHIR